MFLQDLKDKGLSRSNYDSALKSIKAHLSEVREQAEQKYLKDQGQHMEDELKELQRQQLMRYHSLEIQLTNNVLLFL